MECPTWLLIVAILSVLTGIYYAFFKVSGSEHFNRNRKGSKKDSKKDSKKMETSRRNKKSEQYRHLVNCNINDAASCAANSNCKWDGKSCSVNF